MAMMLLVCYPFVGANTNKQKNAKNLLQAAKRVGWW